MLTTVDIYTLTHISGQCYMKGYEYHTGARECRVCTKTAVVGSSNLSWLALQPIQGIDSES